MQFIDEVIEILVLTQRQIPVVQTLSESPQCRLCREQVQFLAEVVDTPVVVSGRPKPNKTQTVLLLNVSAHITVSRSPDMILA